MSGVLNMGSNLITNLTSPSSNNDAANKEYVDNLFDGVKRKDPADLATTGNITLSGEQTIDGTLTSASRVLVWQQTDQTENGIYTSGAGAWTRTSDASTGDEIVAATLSILGGSTYVNTEFNNTNPSITLGVTNITFVVKAATVDHNSTTGKQGGTTNEYYHLTSAQHATLTTDPNNIAYTNVNNNFSTDQDVTGTVTATITTGAVATFQTTGDDAHIFIQDNDTTLKIGASGLKGKFDVGGTRRLELGTTNAFYGNLDVTGTGTFSDNVTISKSGDTNLIINAINSGGSDKARILLQESGVTRYFIENNANSVVDQFGLYSTSASKYVHLIDSSGNTNLFGNLDVTGTGTFSNALDVRSTASVSFPSSGAGLEIYASSAVNSSYIQSYDRTGSAWYDLNINGKDININANGGTIFLNDPTDITGNLDVTGTGTFSDDVTVGTDTLFC